MPHPTLAARALCDLDDVKRLVPGYSFDEATDSALIDLINGQSDDVHRDTGRELSPITTGSSARIFDLNTGSYRNGKVPIGDCATITTVELVQVDGTVLDTVAAGDYVTLPRVRASWEPIRWLWFPATGVSSPAALSSADAVKVTGTWGFPEIPDGIRVAVAKLVLVGYVADMAASGTELADDLADINVARFLSDATGSLNTIRDPKL